ncbi:MAG TPA: hypothetical protein VMU25_02895 [Candidatus Paceibacterota bacterium]|nr:hypothetical protein [Candidatus Paceibacterota bacterium]
MDNIKDIQRGDDFSRFIEGQSVRTDPFGSNRAAERLYRRVERVTAALYLLTKHIAASEPVRAEVRTEAVSLFTKVLNLKDEMRALESGALAEFQSSIRHLISLVRILTAGGYVSFQNADVVIGALDELGSFVSSAQRSALAEGVVLTREDIVGDTSPLGERYPVKDIKDRKEVRDKNLSDTQKTPPQSRTASVDVRAQGIIAVLRGGGDLGIKDIAARLPDYSEKMIQRELAHLIQSGHVKKDGFKRWSRYSLA